MNKHLVTLLSLLLLGGCSTTGLKLTGAEGGAVGDGAVRLTAIEPHELELRVDGKRFVGPWTTESCTTETCGSAYSEASRTHKRHIRKGRAVLRAEDGAGLHCDWISHLPKVDGTCRLADGRSFKLRGAADASD